MGKSRSRFVCQHCGASSPRWEGRCSTCGAWHAVVEEALSAPVRRRAPVRAEVLASVSLEGRPQRLSTGCGEFDRVLGGGIVRDSVILVAGDPGIGKSTLLLQTAAALAEKGHAVLYVSGEESLFQLKCRAERLGLSGEHIHVVGETEVGLIEAAACNVRPAVVIVDSAQTLRTDACAGSPGTVGQVRESVARLAQHAKAQGHALLIVSHVTKEGLVAGPKVVEHLVDVVLRLEGESPHDWRLLRATKNRFGPAGEVGVFHMEGKGLRPVEHYDRLFRSSAETVGPGAAATCVCEGARPLLVEVQALVVPSHFQIPHRRVSGLDPNRVALHVALLGKRGVSLAQRDVFVNVAGGFRITEPASDLAVILAVASSFFEIPLPPQVAYIAEVGLRSELRGVHRFQYRCSEAYHHGIRRIVAGCGNEGTEVPPELRVEYFSELGSVLRHFFGTVAP